MAVHCIFSCIDWLKFGLNAYDQDFTKPHFSLIFKENRHSYLSSDFIVGIELVFGSMVFYPLHMSSWMPFLPLHKVPIVYTFLSCLLSNLCLFSCLLSELQSRALLKRYLILLTSYPYFPFSFYPLLPHIHPS